MPWKNYAEAKKAAPGLVSITPPGGKQPVPVKNKAALDALAGIYDALKGNPALKNPAGAAKATFLKAWRHKGGGVWAKREPLKKEGPSVTEVKVPFASFAVLTKAYEEGGKRYVVYACADDGPDLQKGEVGGTRTVADVIDLAFLEKMARENVSKAVPLVATHEDPFQAECPLGKAVESWVEPSGSERFGRRLDHNTLFTKFELTDGDPRADVLFKSGVGDGRGTSVHGGITRVAVELAKNAAGFVRRILDGYLDHHAVLVPGRAANPRMGMVAAMSKALEESGAEIDAPEGLGKAEVSVWLPTEHGEARATGYVKTEDDAYSDVWPVSASFAETLAAVHLQIEGPRYANLFKAVVNKILCADPDDVPNKPEALAAAMREYEAALGKLMQAGDLSKSQADELTDAAAALLEGADNETAAGEPAADAGGEAAEQEGPIMADETLDKGLDKKVVAASLRHAAKVFNGIVKLMGGEEGDGVPDGDEEPEDMGKALAEFDAGVDRVALLSKGFAAVVSLDPSSKAKADAEVRANETGQTPVKGALGVAPGAMSKEQVEGLVAQLAEQGYVLAKAEAPPETPPPPAPVADEIERVVGLLADQDLVKQVVAKLPGATREALNKSLAPQAAQPTGEPLGGAEDLAKSGRSDAEFYAEFMRRRSAPQ